MKIKLIIAMLLFAVTSGSSAWCAPVTTYVAGFSISGAGSPDEMKSTIQTLLLTRIASDKIATVGKPDGAEITVSGSYFVSGSAFSLDAAASNRSGTIIARAFSQGKNPDELITAVGQLAKSLSEGIEKSLASAGVHPVTTPAADIVKAAPTTAATGQVIHRLDGALRGLALGRTLPGGERELFVVGNQTLRYYRQGTELKLMASIPYKIFETILAVDSADLNNDGIPEVYVTIMSSEVLVSQVWTVDGTSLKQIAGPLPYYFRTMNSAGGGKKLYAQQISGTMDYSGDVAELVRSDSGYKLTNPVKLPKQGNIYNFSMLKGAGGELHPVIIDRGRSLKVYSAAGDELWKSSEEFGGSETYFRRTDSRSESGYRKVYLEQRIAQKGSGELLAAKNSGSWFQLNQHTYSNNSLYCFTWDGNNLVEKWHTRQSDFYLADFAYDDSSSELLMLEVVAKEEGVLDKGASRLVIRKVE